MVQASYTYTTSARSVILAARLARGLKRPYQATSSIQVHSSPARNLVGLRCLTEVPLLGHTPPTCFVPPKRIPPSQGFGARTRLHSEVGGSHVDGRLLAAIRKRRRCKTATSLEHVKDSRACGYAAAKDFPLTYMVQ